MTGVDEPGRGPLPPERARPLNARLPRQPELRAVVVAIHEQALRSGSETYQDPATGFTVMTALALWRNGSCCRSGCRHCPYHEGLRV